MTAYVLVGRPRALLSGAVATVPATLVVLLVANPPDALTQGSHLGSGAVAAGRHVALVLGLCILGAVAIRAAMLPVDRRLAEFRLGDRMRRPVLAGAATAAVVAIVATSAALNLPSVVDAKYREFAESSKASTGEGSSRLFSSDTNGRQEHWEVALDDFQEHQLHGSGAGTYAPYWAQHRPTEVFVLDAHSLYLETLGELGLVGFVLLVIALGLILGAFAYRARGPDRAMFAALLAVCIGWMLGSGVDWDWEMPAVTLWLFAFGGATLARVPRDPPRGRPVARLVARVGTVVLFLGLAVIPARLALSAARYSGALDAFQSGDCGKTHRDARGSLAASGQRAAPYVLIGLCELRSGNPRAALGAMRKAREHDPYNWATNYDLTVAMAANGIDPRPIAKRVVMLNPLDSLAKSAPHRFGGRNARQWKLSGREAPLLPPALGDP